MTRKHLLGINEVMYSNQKIGFFWIGCLGWHFKLNFIINSQPMIEDLNSCTCIVYPEKKIIKVWIIESSLGSTLGALFGGVVLGALITTVFGFIIHKRIHQNYKRRYVIKEPVNRCTFSIKYNYITLKVYKILQDTRY